MAFRNLVVSRPVFGALALSGIFATSLMSVSTATAQSHHSTVLCAPPSILHSFSSLGLGSEAFRQALESSGYRTCPGYTEYFGSQHAYEAKESARDSAVQVEKDRAFKDANRGRGGRGADLPRKAPVRAIVQPTGPKIAVSGIGFGERERRDGLFFDGVNTIDLNSTSNTYGGVGIITATWQLGGGSYWILGFNGNGSNNKTKSLTERTDSDSYGVGMFAVYGHGSGFSADFNVSGDWDDATKNVFGVGITDSEKNTFTVGGNLSYRFTPAGSAWWVEPTIGARFKHEDLKTFALEMDTTRVTGGIRIGTETRWGDLTVEPVLTASVFSDVKVSTEPLIIFPNDEGKVWGKGNARLNINNNSGGTFWVEAEGRGTDGARAFGGKAGLRKSF